MPQLDLTIIFSQIFWLFLLFIIFYSILLHFFLPKFLISIQARKRIVYTNSNKCLILQMQLTERQKLLQNKLILKLNYIRSRIHSLWILDQSFFCLSNSNDLDKKISQVLFNLANYYSLPVLESIFLFPTYLNLKKSK